MSEYELVTEPSWVAVVNGKLPEDVHNRDVCIGQKKDGYFTAPSAMVTLNPQQREDLQRLMVVAKFCPPAPRLRPWGPDEIEYRAMFRRKDTEYDKGAVHIARMMRRGELMLNGAWYDAEKLLERWEWAEPCRHPFALGVEWKPCGIWE